LEEILSLVKDALGPALPLSRLGGGIVLTGGGSRCRGSRELCEEVFGQPVRTRYTPQDLEGVDRLPEGQWATAVGLVLWSGGLGYTESSEPEEATSGGQGIMSRLKSLFARRGEG